MLKRMIVLMLIMMALQVRAYEPTANNTFIDGHLIKDSLLVMASGAVYGSAIEAICYKFTQPYQDRAFSCKTFAAESLGFINLLQAQQPVWTLATCKNLNLLFVVTASGYIGSTQFWLATISTALASGFCYQLGRISADCAAYYLWRPDLDNLKPVLFNYVTLNGIASGLLIVGLIQWHRQNLEEGLGSWGLTLASSGTALLSTVFYMRLIEPDEQFSVLEKVESVAGATTVALVITVAVTRGVTRGITKAVTGGVIEAGSLVRAGAITGAVVVAVAVAETGTGIIIGTGTSVGISIAGAGAGLLTLITTRSLLQRLSNVEQPHSISSSLAQAALVSVPLLMTSWLLSVNQWVMNNASAHETMQGIYYPDTAKALFSGEWTKALYHLLWLNE